MNHHFLLLCWEWVVVAGEGVNCANSVWPGTHRHELRNNKKRIELSLCAKHLKAPASLSSLSSSSPPPPLLLLRDFFSDFSLYNFSWSSTVASTTTKNIFPLFLLSFPLFTFVFIIIPSSWIRFDWFLMSASLSLSLSHSVGKRIHKHKYIYKAV